MPWENGILLTGFVAWFVSQLIKNIIHFILNHRIELDRLGGDGGMPSSHSAIVTSVAVATGLRCGWDSALFAIAAVLAVIVMHDARGVRQETGKQAKVINNLVELLESMGSGDLTPEETLKEFVGHTSRQVFVGGLLGVVVALLMPR